MREKLPHIPKTEQDLFTYLPLEIILTILSRLPVRAIISCKCVCKPWLDLLMTPEFVKSRLSKSVAGLPVITEGIQSKPFKVVEYVDADDLVLASQSAYCVILLMFALSV